MYMSHTAVHRSGSWETQSCRFSGPHSLSNWTSRQRTLICCWGLQHSFTEFLQHPPELSEEKPKVWRARLPPQAGHLISGIQFIQLKKWLPTEQRWGLARSTYIKICETRSTQCFSKQDAFAIPSVINSLWMPKRIWKSFTWLCLSPETKVQSEAVNSHSWEF